MQIPYFTRTLLLLTCGPLVWAIHFLFIYVITALVCARPSATMAPDTDMLQWVIGAATAIAVIAILYFTIRGLRSGRRDDRAQDNVKFVEWSALGLGAFSIYAIVLDALPVLFIPACA